MLQISERLTQMIYKKMAIEEIEQNQNSNVPRNTSPVAQNPSSFCDIVASAVARTSPEMIVHSARWVSMKKI